MVTRKKASKKKAKRKDGVKPGVPSLYVLDGQESALVYNVLGQANVPGRYSDLVSRIRAKCLHNAKVQGAFQEGGESGG